MDSYHPNVYQGPNTVTQSSGEGTSNLPTSSAPRPATGGPIITPAGPPSSAISTAPRIRRRNRMITSCLECRRRKLKCNKSQPCTNCTKFKRSCLFLAPALDQASQLKLTEIKEKVGSLERLLERDVARSSAPVAVTGGDRGLPGDLEDDESEYEKDYLEPTPLAVIDAAYEMDGDDNDLLDLGIQMGKMRITERIGGFFRPKISQELQFTVSDNFLPGGGKNESNKSSPAAETPIPIPPAYEWLKPGQTYITPSSGFFFGSAGNGASIIDFLPSRLAADRLIKQYLNCVHTICQVVHAPTFEKEYDIFWDEISQGIEPPPSVQAVVFAAMFSAVASMDEALIIRDLGAASKAKLQENLKVGTETALSRANFLRTTKIEILQAFVMYLIPLCRAELSRAHSVLVGGAIRMAECMGLHRDGETYGMNPLETHIRRLVWYQLCFLDIRTCEIQGPRPTIRHDEFDTKLPLNIDDIDLHPIGRPPVNADRFTDSTISLIRFEINEMMRIIWFDRPRVERRKISLTAVLGKIETFRTNMAMKYDKFLDERIPLQKFAKIVKALLLSRLHIMVLHRYHNSVAAPMPEKLRNIMLASGTLTLETAITLETLPELHPWAWYGGAFNQYHTAFLLLMEVYIYPDRKEADRIWACLDYIYECNPPEPRRTKAKKILSELQQKTAVYQSMRGMRAPIGMNKHINLPTPPPHTPLNSNQPPPSKIGTEYVSPPQTQETITAPVAYAPGVLEGVPGPAAGRMPYKDPQSADRDTSALWAMTGSGSSSDTASNSGQKKNNAFGPGAAVDELMNDIDWDAFDALFPPDQTFDMPDFILPPATYFTPMREFPRH